jgi:hypothetical protein
MNIKTTIKHISVWQYIAMCVIALLFTACSKSNDPEPKPEPEPPVETGIKTGIYTQVNLESKVTHEATSPVFYFSLDQNKAIPASQVLSDNWDIAFKGMNGNELAINNGKAQYSPGYGGPGKGGIYMVIDPAIDAQYYDAPGKAPKSLPTKAMFEQAFDNVKTVSITEDKFKTNDVYGLDYFSGSTAGWMYYDFYGTMFPDRPAAEKSHVVYAFPRTFIIRTAKGKYAKLIVYSIYKDAPVDPDRSNIVGFLNFKFAIQQDGSKNLDIK